jgi:putative tryptophan/tyrosine transport system substrate-binding protein
VVLSLGVAMRRRVFLQRIAVAAAWPLAARAQTPTPVIGFLSGISPGPAARLLAAFRRGLNENGFTEGQNVAIEFRWAEGHYDRLPALAADLLRHQPAVLVATGGPNSARAAKAATATVPIVYIAGDPVREGLAQSLNRPGTNATGVGLLQAQIESKRLGLLRDLAPTASLTAVLLNPTFTDFDAQLQDIREAAKTAALEIHVLRASAELEIEAAFAEIAQIHAGALLVASDPYFNTVPNQIVVMATRYAIPAIYETREFTKAGGLASYGVNLEDAYDQIGIYTGRILKGEKPADLPIIQPTKFDFVINLKTAKALSLNVPLTLQMTADEIIE